MTDAELDDRVAERLVAYGALSSSAVERAAAYQRARGGTLVAALLGLHLAEPDTVAGLLEELTGVRAVDPTLMTVYPDFLDRMNALLPPSVVVRLHVFPAQMELNAIHVCMINPTDASVLHALESLSGCRVVPFVAPEGAIAAALERHYRSYTADAIRYAAGGGEAAAECYRDLLTRPFDEYLVPALALINRQRDAIGRDRAALEAVARDPLIIRLVQQILSRAVEAGASDIHFESTGDSLRIRLRVDGAMRNAEILPANAALPLIARLKAMADLPVGPAAAPLDARISYDIVWGRAVDLRFSLVPSVTGEMVVLRVLDRSRERRSLADIGLDPESRAAVEAAADLPNGLLLVTGPTGSGKSSTLYAVLDRLNDESTCIVTAEDPVESRIAGVRQVQCDDASGVTFASALRSFLRQDPDVMMVGEIRDLETADTALKAALTGHLVLSSLHTNDAPGAVLRLVNMGIEPFLIASALRLVVAQRLIRRLCDACKRPVPPERTRALTPDVSAAIEGGTIFDPVGCPACGGSGYRGRTGIFEVLRMTEDVQEIIVDGGNVRQIRACGRAHGMQTLRSAALQKVALGETSIAEALEHTVADETAAISHEAAAHV